LNFGGAEWPIIDADFVEMALVRLSKGAIDAQAEIITSRLDARGGSRG
jgi:hypothetical protein